MKASGLMRTYCGGMAQSWLADGCRFQSALALLPTQVCGLRTLSLANLPRSQLSIKMAHIAAYYDAETILMVTV